MALFSNVRLFLNKNANSTMKASGKVCVADCMDVSIRVQDSKKGLFVGLPSHKGTVTNKETNEVEEKWFNDVEFSEKEKQAELHEVVMSVFNKLKNGQSKNTPPSSKNNTSNKATPPSTDDSDDYDF